MEKEKQRENNRPVTPAQKKQYEEYVKQITPTHPVGMQMTRAFLMGGCICTVGQGILNFVISMGVETEMAGSWCSMVLILMSALLTGANLYPSLVKWGGAGALVPITGFANSVCAPAIEFKKEGQVFGVGCKIFTIAGPVILYGILTCWLLGLAYWALPFIKR